MAAQSRQTKAERELQAYTDELGIRHHAERLEANFGCDRALKGLRPCAEGSRRGDTRNCRTPSTPNCHQIQ